MEERKVLAPGLLQTAQQASAKTGSHGMSSLIPNGEF